MTRRPRLLVVGAGVAGLAAARAAAAAGARVILLEAEARPGGSLRTRRVRGFLLEDGADVLTTAKPFGPATCRGLGLGARLRSVPPRHRSFRLALGPLRVRLPERAILAAAGRFWPGVAGSSPRRARGAAAGDGGGFVTLRDGLGSLVRALVRRLPPGTLRCRARTVGLVRLRAGWRARLAGGRTVDADSVILALPARAAAALVAPLSRPLARTLGSIRAVPLAVVHLAYRRAQLGRLPAGSGLVFPLTGSAGPLLLTCASQRFAGRAPAGFVLFRVLYAMRPGRPAPALRSRAHRLVAEAFAITGRPVYVEVVDRAVTMPRLDRRARAAGRRARAIAARLGGLRLAGSGVDGLAVADCLAGGAREGRAVVVGA